MLRFYEGFTFREVSDILEVPLGTAKTKLYRGLNKLRNHLQGEGVNEE